MRSKLMGYQEVDFEANNGRIAGTNLFVAFPDKNVIGLRVERFFVNEEIDLPAELKAGDEITLVFNYKGKIEAVLKK